MNFWQRAFPHVVVVLGFIILSLAYMSPVFEGKIIMQNDIVQAEGAAHELKDYKAQTGKRSLWANNMFSGMPAFMIYMDYPMSLPTQMTRLIANSLPAPANGLFMYMLGFYIMALLFGFSAWQAGVGGLLFALGSYNVINIEAGHMSKVFALAFAPPLLGAVYYAYNKNWWLGSALGGFFASIQLYANHPQITYYVFLTLVLFAVYQIVQCATKKADWKNFAFASVGLGLMAGIALGTHASRVWTNYEYSSQSNRGKSELKNTDGKKTKGKTEAEQEAYNYAFAWSYGISESFTFLIPNFYGSGSGAGQEIGKDSKTAKVFESLGIPAEQAQGMPYYWGAQPFTSGPAYLGVIVCLLALFGVMASTNPLRWWLLGSSIFLIMIAWGKNFAVFNDLLYYYMPLFSKFRAHTMTLSLLQLFVAGLALLGLHAFLTEGADTKKLLPKLYISGGIIGGLCLVFALLGSSLQDFSATGTTEMATEDGKSKQVNNDQAFLNQLARSFKEDTDTPKRILRAIREDRATMQSNDAWRSFGFVAVTVLALWAVSTFFLHWSYGLGAIALLALLDLWSVDRRYLNNTNFVSKSDYESTFSLSESENKILEDNTRYRVANFNRGIASDAITSYNFPSIGGYHGTKLMRYQEVIEKHFAQNTPAVYDMLNLKYVITQNEAGEARATKSPSACGNAWFVGDYDIVPDADAEIKALSSLKPLEKAIIDKRFEKQVGKVGKAQETVGKIKLTKALPDELTYSTDNAKEQIAIFSEIYYVQEGKIFWQAYIDDKPVPHFRANYILRGLVVPAGKHTIKFKFEAPIYNTGEMIALICSLLLFGLLGASAYFYYRQESAKEVPAK